MLKVGDFFASTYDDARQKFLKAAHESGASLQSHVHPLHRGPTGEDLAVDVATLGDVTSKRVIAVVSGTHGPEGYAGSACQVSLLKSELLGDLTASNRVVLVHAINPFGFAYTRRVNEDNIDLNRNFVSFSEPRPINPHYEEYARAFLPSSASMEDYSEARARREREADLKGGYQSIKSALQPGQYEFARGLYYGGAAPSWSNKVFMQICRDVFAGAQSAALVDIHTGIGAPGVGEVIFMSQEAAEKYGRHFSPPVSCAGAKGSISAAVKGPLASAAADQMQARNAVCFALEFGTVPLRENVEATIFENWTYQFLPPDHPARAESVERLRRAYYLDDDGWKIAVINRAHEILRSLNSLF